MGYNLLCLLEIRHYLILVHLKENRTDTKGP